MSLDPAERDLLLSILDFQVAAGVDLALDEHPHDRFAEASEFPLPRAPAEPVASAAPARPQGAPEIARPDATVRPPPLPLAATAPPGEIAADAGARAAKATTLAELRSVVAAFEGCGLKRTAKQIVFADAVPGSRVMILGGPPGSDEDRSGVPFSGRAGTLLDRMLAAIGLDRQTVYLAHLLPWRPPGNRPPTAQEVAICLPFALRQIDLAAPEILVLFGGDAAAKVLGVPGGLARVRGRWSALEIGGRTLPTLPMTQPDYLLRHPQHKRTAWRDLREIRRALDTAGHTGGAATGTSPPATD